LPATARAKRHRRSSTIVFLIPFLVIGVAIAYLTYSAAFASSGTLLVRAGSSHSQLQAGFTANGQRGQTPMNLTLNHGSYTVAFSPLPFYQTPSPLEVTVLSGKTTYAFGLYVPAPEGVAISGQSFNTTSITALHGVTPVTWVNNNASTVTLLGNDFPQVDILPGRSFTHVYASPGTFSFELQGSSTTGTVTVQ
jgi:hypothetical protein